MHLEHGLDPGNELRGLLGVELELLDDEREELQHETRGQKSHGAVDHSLVRDTDTRTQKFLITGLERLQKHCDHGIGLGQLALLMRMNSTMRTRTEGQMEQTREKRKSVSA